MVHLLDECLQKSKTIKKLTERLSRLGGENHQLRNSIKHLRNERDKAMMDLEPTKRSLENMTAVHGKLLRKLKRENSNA